MKKQLAFVVLSFIVIFTIVSCGNNKAKNKTTETSAPAIKTDTINLDQTQKDLLKKDVELSDYSITNGTSAAILNFISDDGVLLMPNHKPVTGLDSITALLNKRKNKKDKIVLSPISATIASSGDLGCVYGTFTYTQVRKIDGVEMTSNGSYLTEWRKDKIGNWKLLLYSSIDGLNPIKRAKM